MSRGGRFGKYAFAIEKTRDRFLGGRQGRCRFGTGSRFPGASGCKGSPVDGCLASLIESCSGCLPDPLKDLRHYPISLFLVRPPAMLISRRQLKRRSGEAHGESREERWRREWSTRADPVPSCSALPFAIRRLRVRTAFSARRYPSRPRLGQNRIRRRASGHGKTSVMSGE